MQAMTTEDDVRDRVHRILAEQAMIGPEDVADDDRLVDLGIDSMALVEAIFAIEEAFDVSVPYNANEPDTSGLDVSTVGAIVSGVRALIADRAR